MEAAGAVIGKIDIDVRNIFDESDQRETNKLYRLADRLHIRTKPSTIRAQLLFKSGEKYQARKLAETERALRLLTFIYDARVVPVHYADGKVDIKVITKDVWTLSPGISFGRSGGTNSTKFNLEEENFLGWGKTVQVSRGSTVDRTTDTVAFTDPNVFGSHWTSAVCLLRFQRRLAALGAAPHPFYSLDTPWSAKISGIDLRSHDLALQPRQHRRSIQRQRKLIRIERRSFQRLDRRLDQALDLRHALRPQHFPADAGNLDADAAKPLAARPNPVLSLRTDSTCSRTQYKKVGDENEIGRTEDLYFGTEVSGEIGYSSGIFGADHDAVMLTAKALHGFELPARAAAVPDQ